MRTLIVDDEPFALSLLERQLARAGLTDVTPYPDAREALELLESATPPIELIFLDLQMPGVDGVQFVRALGAARYTGGLVLVSGEDDRIVQSAGRLARAHRLRVLGVLHKPVSPEQLREVLQANVAPPARRAAPSPVYDVEALREGIVTGQLVNHYQPKVCLADGTLAGVETLVRWRHPHDGMVYPDLFIPLAEQHQLIDELTRAVLRAAVRQVCAWRNGGLDLHVAVNVSMANLHELEFPEWVVREVEASGLPPAALRLEVTESRLMQDPCAPLDILTRLRLKRIGLSIDDFGTGHSSLTQLRDLPFEELKVDRGFVHGACREGQLRAIVDGSLRIAQELRMTTVAEGVEDRADWDYLRGAGCHAAQGYFIGRPMPAEALPDWLSAWEGRRRVLVGEA